MIIHSARRRCVARLILPPLISISALAGCGGSHRQEESAVDAGAVGVSEAPGINRLVAAPPVDSVPLVMDEPVPEMDDQAPPAERCDPNYDPCVPIDSDVDCAGGMGNGPSYVAGPVRVIGSDPYGLDGKDDDGIGCEN
jgi:hypothetical protein